MVQLPISFPDLVEIMRACGAVRAEDCTPTKLRATMTAQLTSSEPSLADRVCQFDADQMQVVCEYILAGLMLTVVPAT
jgi:hypothetical protein